MKINVSIDPWQKYIASSCYDAGKSPVNRKSNIYVVKFNDKYNDVHITGSTGKSLFLILMETLVLLVITCGVIAIAIAAMTVIHTIKNNKTGTRGKHVSNLQ